MTVNIFQWWRKWWVWGTAPMTLSANHTVSKNFTANLGDSNAVESEAGKSKCISFTYLCYLDVFFILLPICYALYNTQPSHSATIHLYELKYMWQFLNTFISYCGFYSDKISTGFVNQHYSLDLYVLWADVWLSLQ